MLSAVVAGPMLVVNAAAPTQDDSGNGFGVLSTLSKEALEYDEAQQQPT